MKNILVLLTLFFITLGNAAAQDTVVRLSEPVWESDDLELFGELTDREKLQSPIGLQQAIDSESDSLISAFSVSVNQVCQKKGCFFVAKEGEVEARITFKDYGFFIPTDAAGKEVVLYGTFTKEVLTEAQAKHYAEDAGIDPDTITGEQAEYSIVATSVLVPKTN